MNKTMTRFGLLGLVLLAGVALAQDTGVERIVVPLSDPARPASLRVELMMGRIHIAGYEGKEVIVEAKLSQKPMGSIEFGSPRYVLAEPYEDAMEEYGEERKVTAQEREKQKQAKTAGMKKIPAASSSLSVDEENNQVRIEAESMRQAYDLEVKTPFNTSLKLEIVNGEIVIESISGEINVETMNGGVKLTNVSGTVVAESTNGDIEVLLSKVAADKPMAFTTFNGDIDVFLPADAKATLRIKSEMGEVYSDFDIAFKPVDSEVTKGGRAEGGRFHVDIERAVVGSINGGGPEYKFQNFRGDIYIRKKK